MVAKENEAVILEAWEQEEQIRIDKAVKVRNCRVCYMVFRLFVSMLRPKLKKNVCSSI